MIISEDEPATSFFNVVSGVVKLFRSSPDGRTQIVGFRVPGEFFATPAGERYTTTAEAVTPVELCRFSRSRLKQLLRESPQLQAQLLDQSYRQLATSEDQMFLLGRKAAREKVATFLLVYGHKSLRDNFSQLCRVDLPMNRADIADFLGLTTETVSRVLSRLKREKLISVGTSHSIYLIDTNALEHIAGTDNRESLRR